MAVERICQWILRKGKRRCWRRGCGVSGQGIVGWLELNLDEESAQIDWRHKKDLRSRVLIENIGLAGNRAQEIGSEARRARKERRTEVLQTQKRYDGESRLRNGSGCDDKAEVGWISYSGPRTWSTAWL
jgi:hypothetical protein